MRARKGDFEVVRYLNGAWGRNLYGFEATTAEYIHKPPFDVHWERVDGVDYFKEEYLYWPMEKKYAASLHGMVRQFFPISEMHVELYDPRHVVSLPSYPDSFDSDTSFDEFCVWARDVIEVSVIIALPIEEASDVDSIAFMLEREIQKAHPIGSLSVNIMTSDNYQAWVEFEPLPYDKRGNNTSRWDVVTRERVIFSEWGR